jgi:hypothetical protein
MNIVVTHHHSTQCVNVIKILKTPYNNTITFNNTFRYYGHIFKFYKLFQSLLTFKDFVGTAPNIADNIEIWCCIHNTLFSP